MLLCISGDSWEIRYKPPGIPGSPVHYLVLHQGEKELELQLGGELAPSIFARITTTFLELKKSAYCPYCQRNQLIEAEPPGLLLLVCGHLLREEPRR